MRLKQSASSPILTVREIAKRICRDHEELEVVVNRIRSWTAEGLLKPTGTKNPGTGRSRFYDASVLIDARVLTALSDGGVTLANIDKFKDGDGATILGLARLAACDVVDAETKGAILYLVIFGRGPSGPSRKGMEHSVYVFRATAVSTFDLSPQDFSKPVEFIRQREHVLVPADAQWSHVLNLTEILRPLRGVVTAVNQHGFVKVDLVPPKGD
jgi:DNA-binding transcriptional MerR regulator